MNAELTAIPYLRNQPHGLMFHRFHVDGSDHPLQGSLSAADFEKILLFVGLENILDPEQWISRLQSGSLGPLDLCLTFDDGLRSQVDYAEPILAKHGLRAFWFVCSKVFEGGIIKSEVYSHAAAQMGGMEVLADTLVKQCPAALRKELNTPEFSQYRRKMLQAYPFYSHQDCQFRFLRNSAEHKQLFEEVMDQVMTEHGLDPNKIGQHLWMDREHLVFLGNNGHTIGLHSHNHPYTMDALSYMDQQAEYQTNFDQLAALTGHPPRTMSHPLNSYNSDTLRILQSLGIECGFRANMMAAPGTAYDSNPLTMAREDSTTLLKLTE